MNNYYYILVSESTVGFHALYDENIFCIEMKIPLNVKKNNNDENYSINTNLTNNNVFRELVSCYFENSVTKRVFILVAFDGDNQGEIMSNILKENLLKLKISEDDIIRIPFLDDQYISVSDFLDITHLLNYKGLNDEFKKLIQHHNKNSDNEKLEILSIEAIVSLIKLNENKQQEFKINNKNVDTFTYITKKLGSTK